MHSEQIHSAPLHSAPLDSRVKWWENFKSFLIFPLRGPGSSFVQSC